MCVFMPTPTAATGHRSSLPGAYKDRSQASASDRACLPPSACITSDEKVSTVECPFLSRVTCNSTGPGVYVLSLLAGPCLQSLQFLFQ